MEDEIAGLTLQNDENDVWSVPPSASKLVNDHLARQIGNFLGIFLDYYSTALGFGLQQCLRIQVFVDVRIPLERKKRHGENFCLFRLTLATKNVSMGWDMSLRVMPHRLQAQSSVWLCNVPVEWVPQSGGLSSPTNATISQPSTLTFVQLSLKDHPMTVVGRKKRAQFTSIVSVVFTGSDSAQALHIFYAAGSTVLLSGDGPREISFRLGSVTRYLRIAGLRVALSIYSDDFLATLDFSTLPRYIYRPTPLYWSDISEFATSYNPNQSKVRCLPPALCYIHAILAHTLTGRKERRAFW
ncbi:hypothetical protein Goari_016394 [Gossypium aridum]|uniref:Uncharacterized protein n=1 Tax=Gossypium aridum TaxID=34290 RepID=A0A7J8WIX9_GOSAI|nr:hypothetical protein [Gossypium aridum]